MKPRERAPIREPGDPLALERCYAAEPEGWSEETLRAAVEMQRQEREKRIAAKARRKPIEVVTKVRKVMDLPDGTG